MSRLALPARAFALVLFSITGAAAHADTYTLTTVASSQSERFLGIDDSGSFTLDLSNSVTLANPTCGGATVGVYSSCYETFYSGQTSPVFTTTAPGLTYDDGAACTLDGLSGQCNNGHAIVSGYLGDTRGTWFSNDDALSLLLNGDVLASAFLNSSGDAVLIDATSNTLLFADFNPTAAAAPLSLHSSVVAPPQNPSPIPEPASWLLAGTGGIILFNALRNKLNRRGSF